MPGALTRSAPPRGEIAYAERADSITGANNSAYADSGLVLPAFTVIDRPVELVLFWPQVLNGTAAGVCQSAICHDAGSVLAANSIITEANFASVSAFASSMLIVAATLRVAGTYRLKARHLVSSGTTGKFGNVGNGVAFLKAVEV